MNDVLQTTEGACRIITLNRPEKRNALNDALVEALKNALAEADRDETLRSIVIRGAGKDFCSGADLESLRKISESSYEENLKNARSLAELFTLIRRVKIPVIAAVHGRARWRLRTRHCLRSCRRNRIGTVWLSGGEDRIRSGDRNGVLAT